METLTLIWFLSCIWAMCFISWLIENLDTPPWFFVVLCPGLNTAFAAYRTYRWIKGGGNINFNINSIKNLFRK